MQDQETKNLIALGMEAEQFINSELGQYVLERAAIQVDAAKDELALIDPEDIKEY